MKKSTLKAALYDPYLHILGGGEKHVISIMQVLAELGFETHIFFDRVLRTRIQERFHVPFIQKSVWHENIFRKKLSWFDKLSLLNTFDVFLYVTDGSYFFSTAKKNFVFCMVPQKNLYLMTPLNRLKTSNWRFISNSKFTRGRLKEWGIENDCLYPYVGKEYFSRQTKKQDIILSVGRFFPHLHSKHQNQIIESFKKLRVSVSELKRFSLVLAGGLDPADKTYFEKLKKQCGSDKSIILKPNVGDKTLKELYAKSLFYWHFSGYGIDEQLHPELVEHLGITPLEAMAGGCIPFCVNAGGPKEILENGVNGFLFRSETELSRMIKHILSSKEERDRIRTNAVRTVKNRFSYEIFKTRVIKIIGN